MIHNLKPYPAYKDSGVSWLGKVPKDWNIIPNRALLKVKKKIVGTSSAKYTLLSLTKQGVIARDLDNPEGKFPASFDTYQEVKSGDLIFCLFDIDETPRTVGLSTLEGMITGAYTIFECSDPIAVKFVYLFYLAMDNNKELKPLYTGLRKVITKSTFLSAKMPLPTSDEQSAIVNYLDYIDRRIQHYIRVKKKLIKLLEEQKQAIIHQAVTRGLDPNVKLKPSGIEWLGEMPEHWDVVSLRLRYTVQLGKMLDSKKITGEHLIPYLRNTDVQWDRINTDNLPKMDIRPDEYNRYTVKTGDLLVCEGGEVGRAAIWVGSGTIMGYQKALHRLRPLKPERDEPRFVYFVLFDAAKRGIFHADGSENTIAHLTGEKLRRYRFVFPPVNEQKAIIKYIDLATENLNQSIYHIEREISLLREYRTRLIADVVTGKLDVREAATSLPEEIECIDSYDLDENFFDYEVLDEKLSGGEISED